MIDTLHKAIFQAKAGSPLFAHVWTWLLRATTRLDTLFAQWKAGTLPTHRTRAPRPKTQRKPPEIRLPQGKAWLPKRIHAAWPAHEQLGFIFNDAEFVRFLAEVPAAARIVRPIAHAVGATIPPPIRPAPRIRKPTKRKPKPKPEPIKWGKYRPHQIKNYSPGPIPEDRRKRS